MRITDDMIQGMGGKGSDNYVVPLSLMGLLSWHYGVCGPNPAIYGSTNGSLLPARHF
jgi:hypothetical protein